MWLAALLIFMYFTTLKFAIMKKLLLSFCIFLSAYGYSQDCRNYYYLQNNKTTEILIYNNKGDMNGRQVYTVSDYKGSANSASAMVNSEMFDKKGKSIAKAASVMKCENGVMMMDMKMSLPQQQAEQFSTDATAQNFYIEYPASMKVGNDLKDGNMEMTIDNKGVKQTLSMSVTNRKVEGQESVTTSAGTWDCFRITNHTKIVTKVMGIGIPLNMDITEWFAPGFGVLKTKSKFGETAVTSINSLTRSKQILKKRPAFLQAFF